MRITCDEARRRLEEIDARIAAAEARSDPTSPGAIHLLSRMRQQRNGLFMLLAARREQAAQKVVVLDAWCGGEAAVSEGR